MSLEVTYFKEPSTKLNIKLDLFIPPCGCEATTQAPTPNKKNMLSNNHMNVFWLTHKLTKGIHRITNVRPGV
jgi:hypothetical protein